MQIGEVLIIITTCRVVVCNTRTNSKNIADHVQSKQNRNLCRSEKSSTPLPVEPLCATCEQTIKNITDNVQSKQNRNPCRSERSSSSSPVGPLYAKHEHTVITLQFYFACIIRCIGLCHYYQGDTTTQRNRRETGEN